MKLVIGIVNNDDAGELIAEITRASFQATRLSTSGGFLKIGNATILVGVEDEKVDEVLGIFKKCCSRRSQVISTTPAYMGEGFINATPIEVAVGGATLFVVDVENFMKI